MVKYRGVAVGVVLLVSSIIAYTVVPGSGSLDTIVSVFIASIGVLNIWVSAWRNSFKKKYQRFIETCTGLLLVVICARLATLNLNDPAGIWSYIVILMWSFTSVVLFWISIKIFNGEASYIKSVK
jgi:hypothetical protein